MRQAPQHPHPQGQRRAHDGTRRSRAQAAARTRGTYLREKFHRLRVRRGYKRAIVAVGHKIRIAAYQLLAGAPTYRELGPAELDALHTRSTVRHLTRRLERLGFTVTLQPLPAT